MPLHQQVHGDGFPNRNHIEQLLYQDYGVILAIPFVMQCRCNETHSQDSPSGIL